jgi:hypothetical protein
MTDTHVFARKRTGYNGRNYSGQLDYFEIDATVFSKEIRDTLLNNADGPHQHYGQQIILTFTPTKTKELQAQFPTLHFIKRKLGDSFFHINPEL